MIPSTCHGPLLRSEQNFNHIPVTLTWCPKATHAAIALSLKALSLSALNSKMDMKNMPQENTIQMPLALY